MHKKTARQHRPGIQRGRTGPDHLPSAYPASNFHVENLTNFVKDVDRAAS